MTSRFRVRPPLWMPGERTHSSSLKSPPLQVAVGRERLAGFSPRLHRWDIVWSAREAFQAPGVPSAEEKIRTMT